MIKWLSTLHIFILFWLYVLTMEWMDRRELNKEYFDEHIFSNQELLVTSKEEMIFQYNRSLDERSDIDRNLWTWEKTHYLWLAIKQSMRTIVTSRLIRSQRPRSNYFQIWHTTYHASWVFKKHLSYNTHSMLQVKLSLH